MKKSKDILINWDQENIATLIATYEQFMIMYRHIENLSYTMHRSFFRYKIKELLEELIDNNINKDKYLDFYEYSNCSFTKILQLQDEYEECDAICPERIYKLAERLSTPYKTKRKTNIKSFDFRSIFRDETDLKKKQFLNIFMLNWLGYECHRFFRAFDDIGFDLCYESIFSYIPDCVYFVFISAFDDHDTTCYDSIDKISSLLHCPFYFQLSRAVAQELLDEFIENCKFNGVPDDEMNKHITYQQKEINILPDCSTFNFNKIEKNSSNGKKYAWLFEDAITICEKLFNWTESYDTYLTWCEEIIDAQNNIPLHKHIFEDVYDERNRHIHRFKEDRFCGYGNSLLSNDSGEENFDYMAMNAKIKKELKAILKKKKAEE